MGQRLPAKGVARAVSADKAGSQRAEKCREIQKEIRLRMGASRPDGPKMRA